MNRNKWQSCVGICSKALDRITECIDGMEDLQHHRIKDAEDCRFIEFELKTRSALSEIFGKKSDTFRRFDSIKFELTSKIVGLEEYSIEQQKEEVFSEGFHKVQELLFAVKSLLTTGTHQYVPERGLMSKNHSGDINIQGHGNVLNLGNGNVQNSVAIKKYLESLKDKIDSSGQPPDEKVEAKGILERVTSNPLLISILGNSIPELIKVFSNPS